MWAEVAAVKRHLHAVPEVEHTNVVRLREADHDILDDISVAWVKLLAAARTAEAEGRMETHFALTRIRAELDDVMDDLRPKGGAA